MALSTTRSDLFDRAMRRLTPEPAEPGSAEELREGEAEADAAVDGGDA